jgi:hypothetical protein
LRFVVGPHDERTDPPGSRVAEASRPILGPGHPAGAREGLGSQNGNNTDPALDAPVLALAVGWIAALDLALVADLAAEGLQQ